MSDNHMKKLSFIILFLFSCLNAQEKLTGSYMELSHHFSNFEITMQPPDISEYNRLKKKPGMAILYSMILPGMGELYAGDYGWAQYLTITDGVIWGTLFGFNIYGSFQRDNYKAFASSKAGVFIGGKDEKFFADLGNYTHVAEFNREAELERNFIEIYNENTHKWNWKSQTDRKEYRKMWKSSETVFNNIRFSAGALILNRIVSVINAVRLVSKHNKNLKEELSWNMYFGVNSNATLPTSFTMNFTHSF